MHVDRAGGGKPPALPWVEPSAEGSDENCICLHADLQFEAGAGAPDLPLRRSSAAGSPKPAGLFLHNRSPTQRKRHPPELD